VLLIAACANTTYKQRVVTAYQATETALAGFQQAEITLYEAKTATALTPEKHLAVHKALSRAFDAQVKVGDALLIWRSGDPAPVTVAEWFAGVERVIAEIRAIAPENERLKLIQLIVPWVRAIVDVANLLKVQAPPALIEVASGGAK